MVLRIPPRSIVHRPLSFIILVGAIGLALVLFLSGPWAGSAMAATPYEYSDGSEGDPGDGVLSPRAKEGKDPGVVPLDGIGPEVDRLPLRSAAIGWSHPFIISPDFRFLFRFDFEIGRANGPEFLLLAGRRWHDER